MRASELLVVWPHRSFRRAPDLDRPELRAAYAMGVERRQAGGRVSKRTLDALDLADPDVRHAYMAAAVEIKGPPSVVLGVLPSLGYALAAPSGPRRKGVREEAPAFLGMLALTWICERADARLRRRRALALGLTRETAPIAAWAPSAVAHLLLSLIVETIAARRGRRTRRTPTDALAAQIVRSVMDRRSWQRAARRSG